MMEDLAPALVMAAIATVFIVWIASAAYKRAKEREYSHRERMRALELGLSEIPGAEAQAGNGNGKKKSYGPGLHAAIWSGVGLGLIGSRALIEGFASVDRGLVTFTTFLSIWGMPALFVGLGLGIYAFSQRNRQNGGSRD